MAAGPVEGPPPGATVHAVPRLLRLTLIGPVDFYNDACQTVLTYQTTVILTR